MSAASVREIEASDLDTVVALLSEGFRRRTAAYWRDALARLGGRPRVDGLPRYGHLLVVGDRAEGVLLVLSASVDGHARSNLSSWYVREAHRRYSVFLYQSALRAKGTTWLNLSPSPAALPIVKAFGFRPYTAGTLALDLRETLRPGRAAVRPLDAGAIAALGEPRASLVSAHLDWGCGGFAIEDERGVEAVLYRTQRHKRAALAARCVTGDPARVANAAGAALRRLARRRIVQLLVDAPPELAPGTRGRVRPELNVRYARGPRPPAAGDLLGTEIPMFGL